MGGCRIQSLHHVAPLCVMPEKCHISLADTPHFSLALPHVIAYFP